MHLQTQRKSRAGEFLSSQPHKNVLLELNKSVKGKNEEISHIKRTRSFVQSSIFVYCIDRHVSTKPPAIRSITMSGTKKYECVSLRI